MHDVVFITADGKSVRGINWSGTIEIKNYDAFFVLLLFFDLASGLDLLR